MKEYLKGRFVQCFIVSIIMMLLTAIVLLFCKYNGESIGFLFAMDIAFPVATIKCYLDYKNYE